MTTYHEHLERLRKLDRTTLEEISKNLPKYGAGWMRSNYREALERALAEKMK